jgi:hypothetical protein
MPILLQEFRQNLNYVATTSIANIITDLNEITEIDRVAEIEQKKYGKQALYYFLGLAASIIIWFFIPSAIFLGLVAFVFAIAWIYALVMARKHGRLNLSNYRCTLAKQILQMLARDIDEANNLETQLSFQGLENKEHRVSTIDHPHKSGWKIDSHEHEWLKIKGQFLDKSRFILTATALSKTQYGWKRGRSGKNKYKSKIKPIGLDISLTLSYSQRRYGAVTVLQQEAMGAVQLPPFCQLRKFNLTDKSINLIARISPEMSQKNKEIYKTITMMLLSIYQVLNLAKILAK